MSGCIALVVGAGRGRRFGGQVPKQYLDLGGQPVLRRSLSAFASHPGVDAVRAVIHADDGDLYARAAQGLELLPPVPGGATRQDSVRLGLESLADAGPATVLIHDAARPFVDHGVISRVLEALEEAPAAIPAVAVADTLKRGRHGVIEDTVERRDLWRAQTPQGFRYPEILEAHRRFAGRQLTDDAAVAENAGLAVALVPGSEENLKVTTGEDLHRAARLLGAGDVRTGSGFDVHRFGPGDQVMLCGVAVPCDGALIGHSDADVGLHALTDALLGAIAAGDIGSHFPPDDPQWQGAPSRIFLEEASRLVSGLGGVITGVDVTLICERPRIAPHRTAMCLRIAEILDLAAARVSVKGTTTERLGFTGRGEGIAAQAVATVRFPPSNGVA